MDKEIELLIDNTANELNVKCEYSSCVGLKKAVEELLNHLRSALYPVIFGGELSTKEVLKKAYDDLLFILPITDIDVEPKKMFMILLDNLKEIRETLDYDVEAAYRGDPACQNRLEVVLAYPAFEAISIYRLAHVFYENNAVIISRIMSEYAHKISGIDIHPGAKIGKYFFIDHGTGVVIGETTVIGNNVKIYQGVTLGAKSFPVGEDGKLIKGIKRHPNIGDDVIIYANATILGGDTTIGKGSIIGGNTWITSSVKEGSKILLDINK